MGALTIRRLSLDIFSDTSPYVTLMDNFTALKFQLQKPLFIQRLLRCIDHKCHHNNLLQIRYTFTTLFHFSILNQQCMTHVILAVAPLGQSLQLIYQTSQHASKIFNFEQSQKGYFYQRHLSHYVQCHSSPYSLKQQTENDTCSCLVQVMKGCGVKLIMIYQV